jgi:hypothetical protein
MQKLFSLVRVTGLFSELLLPKKVDEDKSVFLLLTSCKSVSWLVSRFCDWRGYALSDTSSPMSQAPGGCLGTPPLMKKRKGGTRQIFSPCVSFHLMKEYSSLWYFRHSKAFPRFQTKRYVSGNDLFLFSVFCRMTKKTGNTGAEKLRGRTHPMTHSVYLLYRRFLDSSTKSFLGSWTYSVCLLA